jgi:outer membrane lipoprotein-sorting protein
MKNSIFVILISLFSLNVFAQGETVLAKDPKAKKILDQLSKKTKSYKTLIIKFSYTLNNQQAKTDETLNGYAFLKGKKYKLILPGNEIFSDGKSVWNYLKDAGEINISAPDSSDESLSNPSKLFTLYEKGYKYQFLGEAPENGVKISTIDLFPENPKKKKISRVRMKIDMDKLQIVSIKMFNKDGNQSTIEVSEFKPDSEIPDALFTFDQKKFPKDTEIIDTRD